MTRKKGRSLTEGSKKDWSPKMMKTVVAILLDEKIGWVKWLKTTTCFWVNIDIVDIQEFDKKWAAIFVLSDLNVTDCFRSRDQFLAYLKEMMTRYVPPCGARDKMRFEKARVAYIQQLIAHYDV